MIFTLIGLVVLGVGIAGIISLVFRLLGRRAPRGLMPIVAGVGMFAFVIWNDYSWFGRTRDVLPESIRVAERFTEASPLQPWTYLVAPVNRFSAVDTATVQRNPAVPALVLAQIHLVTRYQSTVSRWQLYDCGTPRRADINGPGDLNPGSLESLDWINLESGDTLREIACQASPPTA